MVRILTDRGSAVRERKPDDLGGRTRIAALEVIRPRGRQEGFTMSDTMRRYRLIGRVALGELTVSPVLVPDVAPGRCASG